MKNLQLLLSFLFLVLLFSCANHVDPNTIPNIGDGTNRTWDQAVYVATHKASYTVVGIIATIIGAAVFLASCYWYNHLKTSSTLRDTNIRVWGFFLMLVILFAAWIHPIFNQVYY